MPTMSVNVQGWRQTRPLIVALGITRDGRQERLGLSLGSTENAVVCTELLQDLLARGLAVDGRVLCVLGDVAVIQR